MSNFKNGDRVIMTYNDGYAEKGWTGEVVEIDVYGNAVRVLWDNGKRFIHLLSNLKLENIDPNNPNLIFRRKNRHDQ